jgi:hypothetical protein
MWLAGYTLVRLSLCLVPHHFLMSYWLWLCLILDIMMICTDFGPYGSFPSSDVPEMVDQQNSWNSLVIGTYFLYLEWNVGMLAVNIWILWLPTPPAKVRVLLVPEQNKRIKCWGHKQELWCHNCSRIKNTTYNSYLGFVDVSMSWAIWCRKIGKTMSLYLEISTCNHMVYLTFPFSFFSYSITHPPYTVFTLCQYFSVWWFTLKRYLCYTLYIVKAKENSREFVWQVIMVDGECCSEWG